MQCQKNEVSKKDSDDTMDKGNHNEDGEHNDNS